MSRSRSALAAIVVLTSAGLARAQVKEPPRAEKLDVQIRYRIRADREERVRQFIALEKFLASLGFEDARKNDPDRDLDRVDPTAERFTGTISSKNVLRLLDDPRILNILFAPAGYTYPETSDKPVPIRVVIRSGLLPAQQQLFRSQTLAQLELLGFADALGYDTRGYTQIKGSIPFKNLPKLVKDLREEPSGWFFADTPLDRLPRPFADRNPIRWVEVMPAVEPVPVFVPEAITPARAKMPPQLRALLSDPAARETPVHVVVLFAMPITDRIEVLRSALAGRFGPSVKRAADGTVLKGADGQPALTTGATLEGAIGHFAVIRFDRPADVERFAGEPQVLRVRIPRAGTETITTLPDGVKSVAAKELLKASGVDELHRLGYTGRGVKIVLVGSDFTGADKLFGDDLPKVTRIIDLTTELNVDIVPLQSDPNRVGTGTAAARAVALAAPDADLVLVRIDPASMFQLFTIREIASGDDIYSEAFRSRLGEIARRTTEITRRKEAAIAEYREAFQDLADDEPAKARRAKAKRALDAIGVEQADLVKRIDRLNTFRKDLLATLRGTRVIVNTLEWESGYPLDSMSLLSRALEQMAVAQPPRITRRAADPAFAPKPPLVWVQAASHSGPAVWGGAFRDANQDGTMEFANFSDQLPSGSWSPQMNFLGFQSPSGEAVADLPAGVKLRLTMQWREPLDPNMPSNDLPIHPVTLRLFRQLDPNGEKRPSDEMAEVARSVGGPYPILLTETAVVYEQILEFTVPAADRYAVVIATGSQAVPLLPGLKREAEINPRLLVETLSGKPADGRLIFRSYVNRLAGVGTPGDSRGAITVGSGAPGELMGGGTGLTLRHKPDLFGPNAIEGIGAPRGTGIATGYVGGIAAALVQAGATGANPFESSGFTPGKPVLVPKAWLNYLRPAR